MKDSSDFTLEQHKGQVMVIGFWAAWCKPSVKSIVKMAEMAASKKDLWAGKVRLVTISIDEEVIKAQEVVKGLPDSIMENVHVGSTSVDLEYGASKMPRVVLVDKEGKIAYIGHPEKLNLDQAIT